MAVSITKLKEQLMERIDTNDLVQVEKVERYIDLVKSFRKISKMISKEGESVTTVNGSQKFTKAHPLIGERNKINAQIIALGKDLGLDNKPKSTTDNQGGYSASDLV
jgi:phage terminase small subunit